MSIVILGRGRVGRGLAKGLRGRRAVTLTSGHRPRLAAIERANLIVLAVPDPAIADVADRIASHVRSGCAVLHCSGSRSPEELASLRDVGAAVGAMHPLVSFTSRPPNLRGTSFLIDGDPRAVSAARGFARSVGARPVVASIHGPAYHAVAALSANGAAALADAAVELLRRLGLGRRDAERAIGALLRSVADNVEQVGVPGALSGPVLRGDADTVSAHRAALRRLDRRVLRAYDAIAPTILETARRTGLSATAVGRVRRALRSA